MSELMNVGQGRMPQKCNLLATVCGLALLTSISAPAEAWAGDADRPTVWIELGSQIERLDGGTEPLAPSFLNAFDHLNPQPVLPLQRQPRYAIGGEGRITVEPKGSDWVLSAAVRYGRSNGNKSNYQKFPSAAPWYVKGVVGGGYSYQSNGAAYHLNASASAKESHAVLDFQAGKDVGLGVFSGKGFSSILFGVRFAQFTNSRKADMNGVPDLFHSGSKVKYGVRTTHHRYFGMLDEESSFHGVGPSISWTDSEKMSESDGGLSLDWGVNASVLFGRQKVTGSVSRTGKQYGTYARFNLVGGFTGYTNKVLSSYHNGGRISRSRSVVVPNVGGFAGISMNFPNGKVSLGYRADFFFGAMDGGIDARKTYNRNFYGPFAAISIGLGE
jgi:hypothetical protein